MARRPTVDELARAKSEKLEIERSVWTVVEEFKHSALAAPSNPTAQRHAAAAIEIFEQAKAESDELPDLPEDIEPYVGDSDALMPIQLVWLEALVSLQALDATGNGEPVLH